MTNGIVQIEVTGPAGVGKTTVLALIKNELETLGFQVGCIEKVALAARSVSRDHFLMSGGYRPVIVLTEKLGSPRFAPPVPDGEAVAELNRALGKAFPDDQVSAIKAQDAALPLVNRMAERLAIMDKHAAIDNQVIQMLIAAGHITNDIATQALKIAHGFEDGPLPSSAKRVEALALRNLADNGCVSEAVVNHALLFARDEYDVPLKPASAANSTATAARPAITAVPDDWIEFVSLCAGRRWAVIPGGIIRETAEKLLDSPVNPRPEERAIEILVSSGVVGRAKAVEALQIAAGTKDGPLKSANNRSWWKDVKPETDLADANDVISCMLEDWQKVGEALGFKDFADPESIISVCNGLFEGAPMDAAEAVVLLDAVIAKLERDDEYGLEADLREARRILNSGATRAKVEPPPSDDFADIREFRRRAADMDRHDAERAASAHEAAMMDMFPYKEVAAVAARDAASAYMETVTQEFDSLPIGPGSIPEAPAPIPRYAHEAPWVVQEDHASQRTRAATWKRDEEKTMLRILLLSAETTGFHGNDPAVHLARIAKWTDDECRAVDDWCVAMHLHAGDRGVRVPSKPIVLAPASFADDARPESICGRITKLIAAETRYPEHHFTPVAMTIAQMFNYVDEDALAILDGIAFKLKHGTASDIESDLLALRTRLTKNKRLHS